MYDVSLLIMGFIYFHIIVYMYAHVHVGCCMYTRDTSENESDNL